jgi:hypothetical protein
MRGLVEELEDYYSGRSSQEWESSPARSVDAGAPDITRNHVLDGKDSKNHLGIVCSSVYSIFQELKSNIHT